MEAEIIENLTAILGKHTFNNGLKVDADFALLVKTITYLVKENQKIRKFCDATGIEYADMVLEKTNEILTGEL